MIGNGDFVLVFRSLACPAALDLYCAPVPPLQNLSEAIEILSVGARGCDHAAYRDDGRLTWT